MLLNKKIIVSIFTIALLIMAFALPCSAVDFTVSNNLLSNSNNATYLINYASNYDDFITSDYVVFQDGDYSYYIAWGNLEYNNKKITSSDQVNLVRYYRTSNTGNTYTFVYSTADDLTLNINDYVVTSNITGMESQIHSQYLYQYNVTMLIVLLCSFGFVVMLISMRGKR